jgi:molybdopterin-biosynthesis enzyme MoeA-like protein
MAGVPKVMNAMMDSIAQSLEKGVPMQSRTIVLLGGEGDAAKPLGDIQNRYSDVFLGSYPFESPSGFATNLVVRSRNVESLEKAEADVKAMAEDLTRAGKARGWS